MTILPERAGLVVQRQFCDSLGELGKVEITRINIGLLVGLAHQAVAVEAVSDAGGMTHQVENGDGPDSGTSSSVLVPSSAFFSTPTFIFAKEGMYFETGSSSLILPSWINSMATTDVITLVSEDRRKMVLSDIGVLETTSCTPNIS